MRWCASWVATPETTRPRRFDAGGVEPRGVFGAVDVSSSSPSDSPTGQAGWGLQPKTIATKKELHNTYNETPQSFRWSAQPNAAGVGEQQAQYHGGHRRGAQRGRVAAVSAGTLHHRLWLRGRFPLARRA